MSHIRRIEVNYARRSDCVSVRQTGHKRILLIAVFSLVLGGLFSNVNVSNTYAQEVELTQVVNRGPDVPTTAKSDASDALGKLTNTGVDVYGAVAASSIVIGTSLFIGSKVYKSRKMRGNST